MLKSRMANRTRGFTLVEIVVVTLIIGVLAAIAVPAFVKARHITLRNRFLSDLRILVGGIELLTMARKSYPPDGLPRQAPAGLSDYVSRISWSEKTPIGGYWDWDGQQMQFGGRAGLSVYQPDWSASQMQEIDACIDDGNLGSGFFRQRNQGYIFFIER